MSERTHNVIGLLDRIDHALEVADKKKSFDAGLVIIKEVMALLGLKDVTADLKSFPRIKANPAWTKNAPDYEDRKASYALSENNDRNIDFKLFWVTKPGKRVISNLVALTPNFEDETFYSNKNVGIDFVLSEHADRLIIVLSNNYKIRVLEIHRRLSNTQKKIFEKWAQEFDFSNKLGPVPFTRDFNFRYYNLDEHSLIGSSLLKMVPLGATCLTLQSLAGHMGRCRYIAPLESCVISEDYNWEYVFVDLYKDDLYHISKEELLLYLRQLITQEKYGVMVFDDGWVLLKRGYVLDKNKYLLNQVNRLMGS